MSGRPRPELTVIGLGNEWRGDDAVGLVVARRLRAAGIPGVEVVEQDGDPTAMLDSWAGAGEAVIVDAVHGGGAPGSVHRFEAGDGPLPAEPFRGSTHAIGLAEALELARSLDRLPARVRVLGIEGERYELGRELTPAVAEAASKLAGELGRELLTRSP